MCGSENCSGKHNLLVLGSSPRRPTALIAQLVRAYLYKIDVQGLVKVRFRVRIPVGVLWIRK